MIDASHEELIEVASELLDERYNPPVHSVAAALRTTSGEIITGLNVDHFSGYVCAETSALNIAVNAGTYEFDSIVAVRKNDDGEITVANMCGKCRQIFHDFAPAINVIVSKDNVSTVRTIDELLPFAFTRQREKIQNLIIKDVVV